MRIQEAEWIAERLLALPTEEISPLIEIGSSTRHFRERVKPHIETCVHKPLRDRGVRIVTSDIKPEDGVEIAGDIYDPNIQQRLRSVNARLLLVCNIFEHIVDRQGFADVCHSLIGPGGRILVTVPYVYPMHLDPIDTMFRPSPEQIQALFPSATIEHREILSCGSYGADLLMQRGAIGATLELGKVVTKIAIGLGSREVRRSRISRLSFLAKQYCISVVLLKKDE